MMQTLQAHFWDGQEGGFFLTADDAERLITRPKEVYDGAMPSGNAAAGLVLERLWKLTGDPVWQARADGQLAFLASKAQPYPAGHCFSLLAMGEALYPSRELVCATSGAVPDGLLALAERRRLHTLIKTPSNAALLERLAPFTAAYPIPEDGALFYLCQNGACAAPAGSVQALVRLLEHA